MLDMIMNKITSEELCKIFFKLEEKYKLLDLTISDVKIWQSLRMQLYYTLAVQANVEEQGHIRLTKFDKFKKISNYFYNSIIYNPFFCKKTEIVVFSHPRPKEVNGKIIDIYTKYFIDDLMEKNINFLELETAYLGEHKKNMINNKSYTDFIVLVTNVFKKFVSIKFTQEKKELLNSINRDLSRELGISIDLTTIIVEGIRTFKIKKYFYKRLFKKLEAKRLYICPSYGNADVVSAAKDLKIEVIEIQHGVFSDYHLGYSFPNRKETLDYFPDKLLVWNQYWKDLVSLPIPYDNIVIRKFDYLENNIRKYSNIEKEDKLVVLSQGNVGNAIANLMLNHIEKFKNLKIIYKLHPGEYDRYKDYKALQKLIEKYKNIVIVEETDIHKLLASSKYQIGINSTALYEGVEFGCETILFDTSGIEYMDKFISFYNLEKIDNLYLSESTKKDLNL